MSIHADELAALRSRVDGLVLARGDDRVAEATAGQNVLVVHDPDVVVVAATEADVSAAVRFAAERGLPISVLATGHGTYVPVSSGLLLSTRLLDEVSIDPAGRSAIIAAGARWRAVIDAAAPHGLAPITGSGTSVGAIGYTLGGGLGPLSRSHGFTTDWVRSFKVVRANGDIVTASADANPDLFWALRGGKSGLGIVVEMTLGLAAISDLYAGSLTFDTPYIEQALRSWIDWVGTAPDDTTTSAVLLSLPPLDFIPEPLRGRKVLSLRFAHPGPEADGERLAAPLRAVAPVYIDSLGPMPVGDIPLIHNDPDQPGPAWLRGHLLNGLDDSFVDALIATVGPETESPFVAVEIRHLGGATRRDVPEGSAAGGRNSDFTLSIIGAVPELMAEVMPQRADAFEAAIAGYISPETNINFAAVPRSEEHYRSAWPAETYERLAKVRAVYDPDGVFARR